MKYVIKGIHLVGSKLKSTTLCTDIIRRAMCAQLFQGKEHASLYAQYRPTYPGKVYKIIEDYYESNRGETCNYDMAVDVGCGSGQSSLPLCDIFKSVIGHDVSEQQITSASKHAANLTFKVGHAEDLGYLQDESVDLITVAQALHWFDTTKFYKEVTRVVKPGGVFVAYGYGNNVLKDEEQANVILKQHYRGLLGSYWAAERRHIDEHYSRMGHPFKNWERIEDESLRIERVMPLDAYIGYLSSWSAWRTYLKEHPGSDKLDKLRERLEGIYQGRDLIVQWPLFMLIGSKEINSN